MPDGKGNFKEGHVSHVEIELSASIISDALLSDPTFVTAVATEVRKQLLKDARFLGNLFGKWAATHPTPNPSKRRVNGH